MNYTKEQLEAINKDNTNIIVSAGAGSGKTAVLTQRVIRKLYEHTHINELLILTFTNKAASEMKDKIRKAILKEEKLKDELDLLDNAYITTFDSYALSIVKKYHYVLGLKRNIKIGDTSLLELKKQEFLEKIFEDYYNKQDPLFLKLVDNFCIKDDKLLKRRILDLNKKLDMLSDKQQYLKEYDAFKNIDNDILDYINYLKEKIKMIENYTNELKYYVDSSYYDKIYNSIKRLLISNNYDEIKKNCNLKLPNLPKNSSEEAKNIKSIIKDLIDNIVSLTNYSDILEIKNELYNTKDNLKILIKILIELDDEIKNYKNNLGIYEFNDIALMAIKLVKEQEEIAKEIKNSFKEILIDEYQDTNDLQEEFISYIANNNVYMVGDIKQAIYRFRNANPYLFKEKYDLYQDGKLGIKIDLNKNFRSRKEVLANINTIFNELMDDSYGNANYQKDHQMIYGNLAYDENKSKSQDSNMDILTYCSKEGYSNAEIEAFIIANDIKKKIENKYLIYDDKIREVSYRDFAILFADSTNYSLYKKVFEYMKIPLSIIKDERLLLKENVLKNIICLIECIYEKKYDDNFKLAFLSVARSFLCEIDDNDIFDMFLNNDFINNEIYLKCKKIASNIDNLSLIQILDLIVEEFNYYENLIKVGNIDNRLIEIDKLYDIANDLMEVGYNLKEFNDYLKQVNKFDYKIEYKINEKEEDTVKMLTIHKSKGLEYKICYFAGLDKKFNLQDIIPNILYDKKYGIIISSFSDSEKDTIYKKLVKDNYLKDEISEKIRLFYVALTRAREKIIMVINEEEKKVLDKSTFRSFKDMLDYVAIKIDKFKKNIDINTLGLTKDYQKQKKLAYYYDLKEVVRPEELDIKNTYEEEFTFSKKSNDLIDKETAHNLQVGNDIHESFERFDFKVQDFSILDKFSASKMQNFLKQKLLSNISKANIYQEYEFIYEQEDNIYHGIIDLMLEYDDHIDIIDYKLNDITDNNYLKQLNGYKNYISKIVNKPINIYLYSILQDKIVNLNLKEEMLIR